MKSKALHYLHTHTPVMVRTFPKSGFIILTVDSPFGNFIPFVGFLQSYDIRLDEGAMKTYIHWFANLKEGMLRNKVSLDFI